MSAFDAEINRVVNLGSPVLFADTCSVLDLLRDPTRETVQDHERKAALQIIAAMETRSQLVGFLADQVIFELSDNLSMIEAETARALQRVRVQIKRMDAVDAVYGGTGVTSLSHFDDHLSRARAVYDRWLAASLTAVEANTVAKKAMTRVNLARTPARRGSQSAKDCVVIETYLDVAHRLRSAGLGSAMVFLSSNTKDYTGETRQALIGDLAADFLTVGLEYAPNFGSAKHILGL